MTIKQVVRKLALITLASLFMGPAAAQAADFDATIPVVDMNDFYNPETKQRFVDQVAKALHEVGFFAVINPGIDIATLEKGYAASKTFFSNPMDKKTEIFKPELNGQRGFVPGETAQTAKKKDVKEFLHIGRDKNLWPTWMDLEHPMQNLMASLDEHSSVLQQAFALALGEPENYFTDMTTTGACLLRALYYPAGPAGITWAAEHTDIDLFAILPMATEEGLQVFHDGKWIEVKVPADAFIVNAGDMLENITNGFFKSALHRVVAKPNTERYSIVYFIHPRYDDSMAPSEKSVARTGGVRHYPKATGLQLLASRLRELGLASPELLDLEKNCGVLDEIKNLVDAGVAAAPVQRTYSIWLANQAKKE